MWRRMRRRGGAPRPGGGVGGGGELLPAGRLLDLGCGVGHSFHLLAPRETVGVDIAPEALAGQERETHVADIRSLSFPAASFASVLSVQSLEHVPDPERVVREVRRVLAPDGVAMFVTPNTLTFGLPDEIVDPYHYVEFDEGGLRALCEAEFGSVELRGLFGSERYLAIVERERERLEALVRRDPLRLRRLAPRPVRPGGVRPQPPPGARHRRPGGGGDRSRRLRAARPAARGGSRPRRGLPVNAPRGGRVPWGVALAGLVLLGLALRLLYAHFAALGAGRGDDLWYHTMAHAIADGHGLSLPRAYLAGTGPLSDYSGPTVPTAYHPPLFPALLAIPTKLGLGSFGEQRAVGCAMGAATVGVIGLAGRRLAGDRFGLAAAALAAV